MYPASDAHARILRMIGPVVQCESEPEMRALVTVTGTIAAFHRVQDCAFEHLRRNGVAPSAAASYVGSFYSALANFSVHAITSNADRSADEQSPFAALAEEATTPGGLNEQYAAEVQRDGAFDALEKGLSNLLARLNR
jgi:pyrroline-5-carboxylate reductase